MDLMRFDVLGIPAPQGSKTRFPNGGMRDGTSASGAAKLRDWRSAVAEVARDQAARHGKIDTPVALRVWFRFPMPASRPMAVRRVGWAWKRSKPDVDKLLRSTLDALVIGGLLSDDAVVVDICTQKVEIADGWTGAMIRVSEPMVAYE